MSLRLHLILLVLVCMLPAVALLAIDQVQLRRARETEVRREILEVAESGAGEVNRVIEGGKQLLTALEQAPAIRERNAPFCSALLGRLQQEYPIYASIVATDPGGRAFCTSIPAQAVYETGRPWFKAALATGGFVVGDYALSPPTHAPVLPMARPVVAPDGTVLGVLVLSLDLDKLGRDLAAKLPPGAALTLLDRNGAALLHVGDGDGDDHAGISAGTDTGSAPSPGILPLLHAAQPATADVTGSSGAVQIVAAAPAGDRAYGLSMLAARSEQAAFSELDSTTLNGIVLIVAGLTLALLIAALIAWRFIQLPVRELLRTAQHLRHGEYTQRARVTSSGSELGRLGQALNALAFALAERERDRDSAETQLLEFTGTLERRVEERTQALAEANARLAAEAEERQRAQATLAQAQKLDALGQLTGGVAHDFNNLLAAILGSLEIALKRVEETRVHRLLTIAQRAAERGAKLTAHLLAFSRKQELVLRPVNVNDSICGMSDMLGRTIGPMIQVQQDLAADLWPAVADPVQIEVALLNLALNARDAMAAGGMLTLRTCNVVAARPAGDVAALPQGGVVALPQGDYVMVTVSDTGHGMPADVQARAFEPFFTTKGVGKGTGLGLSMVYGFVTQAGGTVTIDSVPEQGTAVSLYLPRAALVADDAPAVPAAIPCERPLHILVVDDDPDVREAAQEMLRELGHAVTAADSGAAGLALLRGPEAFDLLLVDFAMPEMTGAMLEERALALRPELRVLLMTGYADAAARQSWTERGIRPVMKPFSIAELGEALLPFTSSAGELETRPRRG